ncbi:hypothetical protein BKK79_38240 (plasmid) [Cupriavidus sp. USMAA2-4]|uniref:recombination directionality factor n=1 Tax=Cupriavidus sp. USMAA2-4 TaxID=876364 RepID=UPI0008A6E2EF|nr:hypothetical protein [Cupriavidus sp. USMAA2-4]AOY97759.1 hypothetical protein BKK79_38240 [Cupriavidus sp. USMAA2-4]
MQPAITYSAFSHRRSLLEERPSRPPIIGKIRPGIQVLTKAARENKRAVEIHDTLLAQGESFERIAVEIERQTKLRNALRPKNVGYFTCRRSDFTNPAVADEILQRYGEDRGDGLKLWRFPVLFAFDDWLSNMPNQLTVWGSSGRHFFSEYGSDGLRYCKTYAPAERDDRASRIKRLFGGRTIILRQDDAIPDGVCDPHRCPQYQARQCNLSANFYFAIPEIKGLGLIELPTNSIYVLQKAYAAMQTVALARGGRLVGIQFTMSKLEAEISRIDEDGRPVRQKQMLTTIDADIDLGALLDGADHIPHAIEAASQAVSALEQGKDPVAIADGSGADPGPETTGYASDDPEDRLHRLEDLIVRLGLAGERERHCLRVFAHVTFGKGWAKRPADVEQLIAEMSHALANPAAFSEQVRAVAADAGVTA